MSHGGRNRRDQNKESKYHAEKGHTTNECYLGLVWAVYKSLFTTLLGTSLPSLPTPPTPAGVAFLALRSATPYPPSSLHRLLMDMLKQFQEDPSRENYSQCTKKIPERSGGRRSVCVGTLSRTASQNDELADHLYKGQCQESKCKKMLQCVDADCVHGPGRNTRCSRGRRLNGIETVLEEFIDELDLRVGIERNMEQMEEVEEVSISEEEPTRTIRVGKNLPPVIREDVINTVKKNQDVLAWSHSDMTEIDRNTIFHALNIYKDATPTRQKRRPLDPVRAEAIKDKSRQADCQ
uniref:Uncharacterized protein n=1 Tax=Cannabis sativa TaxID=3483 RepID=A0A803QCD2_CANSA